MNNPHPALCATLSRARGEEGIWTLRAVVETLRDRQFKKADRLHTSLRQTPLDPAIERGQKRH